MPSIDAGLDRDKVAASFLLGGCGDALGAPLESIRSLDDITARHGAGGLDDLIPFTNVFDTGLDYPAGRLTDDTTMMLTTAGALMLAAATERPGSAGFTAQFRALSWQGYINWGAVQEEGAALTPKADAAGWPDSVKPFWFFCGAGRGTIAALRQPAPGDIHAPLTYDCVIRGKKTTGPNQGCGGMMRIAPVGLLPNLSATEVFTLACANASLTHGHADAVVASGVTALLTHFALAGKNFADALAGIDAELDRAAAADPFYASGVAACKQALAAGKKAAAAAPAQLQTIDRLPADIGYKNPFLAIPVLAQLTYALAAAFDDAREAKSALVLAANHSGDSDSVAAIAGNILGARHGGTAIPATWLEKLLQKNEIEKLAADFSDAVLPPPAPLRRASPPPPK